VKILLTTRFAHRGDAIRTPIALMDLSVYGRAVGHEIDVAYVEELPVCDAYDMIGLSALTIDSEHLADDVRTLRQKYHGRIVMGGKRTGTLTAADRAMLHDHEVEVYCGPGESFLSMDREVSWDNYPFWSEDDFRVLDRTQQMVEVMGSRGCPYHCNFCNNTEPRVRWFSPERTAYNAKMLLETFKRSRVFFVDDIFALRADRMMAVLEAADRLGVNLRKRTCFFVHVSLAIGDCLQAIDAFDPMELQIGIESGDDRMLQAMGKTFTAAEAEYRIRSLYARGHRVACLFLFGFPGETRESLQATVEFVTRNRQYMSGWWVSYYQPVLGTEGWKLAKERSEREINGGWNTDITYLDPNLTVDDLTEARRAIMG